MSKIYDVEMPTNIEVQFIKKDGQIRKWNIGLPEEEVKGGCYDFAQVSIIEGGEKVVATGWMGEVLIND